MVAKVTTDVAAMNAAAGHVEQVNHSLTGIVNALRGDAQSAEAAFKGKAGSTFQSLMVRYDEASKRLNQSLNEIAEKIRQNGKGYDEAEQVNQDAIARVGNSGSLDV